MSDKFLTRIDGRQRAWVFPIRVLWFGRLLIKWNTEPLFSERTGAVPSIAIGIFRLTWRRL